MLPAVDLLGEEAVRLEQGDFGRVAARAQPEELVRRCAAAGARMIHVVDLDGARRGLIRTDVISSLVEAAGPAKVQASGGIRSLADAERLLAAGAARVVVGTAALAEPGALEEFAVELGDRLLVAIDVRGGRLAVRGWLEDTGLAAAWCAAPQLKYSQFPACSSCPRILIAFRMYSTRSRAPSRSL